MEPDSNGFDPRKIKAAWTFGPIMWNKYPVDAWPFPPLSEKEMIDLTSAINQLADELETQIQLDAMDLLETEVEANDCAQARQMLDELFKQGS
jgi:hypothetical protein